MILEALQHLGHGQLGVTDVAQSGNDTDRNGILVGVQESAAKAALGGITGRQPCSTLAANQTETLVDDLFAELDGLLGAHSDLMGLQFLLHAQLLS